MSGIETAAAVIGLTASLLDLVVEINSALQQINATIARARAEGRDVSMEELSEANDKVEGLYEKYKALRKEQTDG